MTVNNSTKHIDRRIVRTRRAIHIAFIDLLTEYEYTKITITALAKRADIDRKTFYTHYSSIDSLFEDVIRQHTSKGLEGLSLNDLLNDPSHFAKNISMPCRQPCRSQNNNVQTCLSIFLCTNSCSMALQLHASASINQIKIYQPKQNAISI